MKYPIKVPAYGLLQNGCSECSIFSSGKEEACLLLDYYLKRNHSGAVTGIPKSWAEFLFLGSCCNFDIQTLSKGFEGRKPARKNSSRKGGRSRYQRGRY